MTLLDVVRAVIEGVEHRGSLSRGSAAFIALRRAAAAAAKPNPTAYQRGWKDGAKAQWDEDRKRASLEYDQEALRLPPLPPPEDPQP